MNGSAFGGAYVGQQRCASTPLGAAYKPSLDGIHIFQGVEAIAGSSSTYRAWYRNETQNYTAPVTMNFHPSVPEGAQNGNEAVPAREMTATELGNVLKQNRQAVEALLRDVNNRPVMTPELTQALNDLRKSLEAANGDVPAPDIAVQPDYADNVDKDGQTTQFPEFCSWATVVCDWMKWTREKPATEQVDVPEEELDLTAAQWSSGIGGGSCPAPLSVAISTPVVTNIEFTYQPLCDLASLLKPLFIASAAIVAAFIIGGGKRA